MKIRLCRSKLNEALENSCDNGNVNAELEYLWKCMNEWKWKMSAAGFFIIDRRLMGGVCSKFTQFSNSKATNFAKYFHNLGLVYLNNDDLCLDNLSTAR